MLLVLNILAWLVILGGVWYLVKMLAMPTPVRVVIDWVFVVALILAVLGLVGVGPFHPPKIF